MKKILAITITVILTACGSSDDNESLKSEALPGYTYESMSIKEYDNKWRNFKFKTAEERENEEFQSEVERMMRYEPQVEEPQVEEPQVEEPQVEEPQVEEPQVEELQADGPQLDESQ